MKRCGPCLVLLACILAVGAVDYDTRCAMYDDPLPGFASRHAPCKETDARGRKLQASMDVFFEQTARCYYGR